MCHIVFYIYLLNKIKYTCNAKIHLFAKKPQKQNKSKAYKNKQTNFHQINFIYVRVINQIICKKIGRHK